MQSIEEKIYEVFWDKNIARMINRADLFSFLKQYVNPGLLTRSSKSELVHDLKEYMTTANLEFIAERMESFTTGGHCERIRHNILCGEETCRQ